MTGLPSRPEDDLAQRFAAFRDADPARLAVIPKDSSADAHRAILERMGAPLDGAAFGLEKLEGADKRIASHMSGALADARLMPWQVAILAREQMTFSKQQAAAEVRQAQIDSEAEQKGLAQEWGGQALANTELARRAARAARARGIDANQAISYLESALGYKGVMQLMAKAGAMMSEGHFVEGSRASEADKTGGFGSTWYKDTPGGGDFAKRMYPKG